MNLIADVKNLRNCNNGFPKSNFTWHLEEPHLKNAYIKLVVKTVLKGSESSSECLMCAVNTLYIKYPHLSKGSCYYKIQAHIW